MVRLNNATRIATTAVLLALTVLPEAGRCGGCIVGTAAETTDHADCPACVLETPRSCCSGTADRECPAPSQSSGCCGCCKQSPQDRAPENTRTPRRSQTVFAMLPTAKRSADHEVSTDRQSETNVTESLARATVLCVWLI